MEAPTKGNPTEKGQPNLNHSEYNKVELRKI